MKNIRIAILIVMSIFIFANAAAAEENFIERWRWDETANPWEMDKTKTIEQGYWEKDYIVDNQPLWVWKKHGTLEEQEEAVTSFFITRPTFCVIRDAEGHNTGKGQVFKPEHTSWWEEETKNLSFEEKMTLSIDAEYSKEKFAAMVFLLKKIEKLKGWKRVKLPTCPK